MYSRGLVLLISPFIQCLASIVPRVVVAMAIGIAIPIFCHQKGRD
jgi:ABC-type multidrug transport system permease subunit